MRNGYFRPLPLRSALTLSFPQNGSDRFEADLLSFGASKVEEGKRLLRYTDKSISSIAAYLGFSSQSHFANVFRKYANSPPNEYRQKHNK